MRKKAKIVLVVSICLCLMLLSILVFAESAGEIKPYKWEPATLSNYSCKLMPFNDSFEVKVYSTTNEEMWGIQIISNVIPTEKRQYLLTFKAVSNKSFTMYTSLQMKGDHRRHLFHDETTEMVGDNGEHFYDQIKFEGNPAIKGALHFKIGMAPVGTVLKIRDVSIQPIGN